MEFLYIHILDRDIVIELEYLCEDMPIDKRKLTNMSDSQTWFYSMYFSTHTLYLFLIFISIAWNGYNTHQYRILAERQSKLENILTELLPSSSSIPSFYHQPSTIEQWFNRIFHFIQQLTSRDTKNNNSTAESYPVRIKTFISIVA
jgi:hypothetical protein